MPRRVRIALGRARWQAEFATAPSVATKQQVARLARRPRPQASARSNGRHPFATLIQGELHPRAKRAHPLVHPTGPATHATVFASAWHPAPFASFRRPAVAPDWRSAPVTREATPSDARHLPQRPHRPAPDRFPYPNAVLRTVHRRLHRIQRGPPRSAYASTCSRVFAFSGTVLASPCHPPSHGFRRIDSGSVMPPPLRGIGENDIILAFPRRHAMLLWVRLPHRPRQVDP